MSEDESLIERVQRLRRELAELRQFQAAYLERRAARRIHSATDLLMSRYQETLAETLDLLESLNASEQQCRVWAAEIAVLQERHRDLPAFASMLQRLPKAQLIARVQGYGVETKLLVRSGRKQELAEFLLKRNREEIDDRLAQLRLWLAGAQLGPDLNGQKREATDATQE